MLFASDIIVHNEIQGIIRLLKQWLDTILVNQKSNTYRTTRRQNLFLKISLITILEEIKHFRINNTQCTQCLQCKLQDTAKRN